MICRDTHVEVVLFFKNKISFENTSSIASSSVFPFFPSLLLTNSPSASPRGIKFPKGNLFSFSWCSKACYVHNCFAIMSTISATQEDLWSHKACVMTCLSQILQRKLHPATHLHFLCCYHLAGCLYPCVRAGWICVVWDLCWGFVGCLLFLWKKLRRLTHAGCF